MTTHARSQNILMFGETPTPVVCYALLPERAYCVGRHQELIWWLPCDTKRHTIKRVDEEESK